MSGRLKDVPEDFVVEEIPEDVPRVESGKYTIIKVKLKNWDTNRFLVYLSKYLGISKKRITYCGTKDKRGITTQYFCLNHSFDPSTIRISDVDILDHFSSDKMLGLGDLRGNRFIINLKTSAEDIPQIRETYDQVMTRGGFPNFFGLQRFGNLRTNTHRIGKLMVEGEYEKAAMTYLYDPEFDREDYRLNFSVHNDPKVALKEFPERLSFERSLLGYMDEHGNLKEAFSVLPRNLSMMFVHAYQSYIFNMILSERMAEVREPAGVLIGDVVFRVDDLFNPDKSNEISVNKLNQPRITEMVLKDQVRPTIPLIGYETSLSKGLEGEIEARAMEREKVTQDMFRIKGYPDLSSKGERRIISCKPVNFVLNKDGIMEFSLGRGIYATSLLREFMKDSVSAENVVNTHQDN